MPDCIALNCTNCGATLEVPGNVDRFACAYCGSQMQVRRSGGMVSLHRIEDAIQRVQSATNKAAAELAITRLEKERERLIEADKQSRNTGTSIGMMIATAFAFPAVYLLSRGGSLAGFFGFAPLVCAAAGFYFGHHFCRDRSIRGRITETERNLAQQRLIANS